MEKKIINDSSSETILFAAEELNTYLSRMLPNSILPAIQLNTEENPLSQLDHFSVQITKEGFYMVGDNQTHIEGPLQAEQIHGKLIEIIRKGKSISVENIVYRVLSWIWLCLRPIRRPISVVIAFIKKKLFYK